MLVRFILISSHLDMLFISFMFSPWKLCIVPERKFHKSVAMFLITLPWECGQTQSCVTWICEKIQNFLSPVGRSTVVNNMYTYVHEVHCISSTFFHYKSAVHIIHVHVTTFMLMKYYYSTLLVTVIHIICHDLYYIVLAIFILSQLNLKTLCTW